MGPIAGGSAIGPQRGVWRGLKESALESLRFNDDLHRSILVHERDADAGVVPLEEALIVNDPAERRRLMLSMLTEEPDAYLAQLQAAKQRRR